MAHQLLRRVAARIPRTSISRRGARTAHLAWRANCDPAGHETLFEGGWAGYEFGYDGVGAMLGVAFPVPFEAAVL